ncbi:hypothetical protein C0052_17525 [Pseudomonas aeruginosa]|nr:hypothetical protein C0052_17525 [Pseudomonas aeruginosa]
MASVSTAGSTTRFDYDAVGQITRVTRGDGSWLSYEYDDARRLVQRRHQQPRLHRRRRLAGLRQHRRQHHPLRL